MDKKDERLIGLIKNAQQEFSQDYLVLAMPGFLTKKFIAYCAMNEDMELILKYIILLKEKPDNVLESALTYSIISLYGKCFTDASKNKFPKLEANIFEGYMSLIQTHEYLMDLRHQFIAHRGETESEIGIAYMIIPKEIGNTDTQVRFSQVKQKSFSADDLNRFEIQANFIKELLLTKIQKAGQKLHDGYLNLFEPQQIVNMLVNNAK